MKKIQRQLAWLTMRPPMTGPRVRPTYTAVTLSPRARPRSEGGNAAVMIPAAVENMKAPPAPWMQRPRIITAPPGRQPGQYRAHGEHRGPQQVEAYRPVRVGQPPHRDEKHAGDQQIGRLGPQALRVAQMEVGAHRRQGHGHDARVEGGHERPDGHDRQRVPAAPLELGLVGGRHSWGRSGLSPSISPRISSLLGISLMLSP